MTHMIHLISTPCLLTSLIAPGASSQHFPELCLCISSRDHLWKVSSGRAGPGHVLSMTTSPVSGTVPRSLVPIHVGDYYILLSGRVLYAVGRKMWVRLWG